MVVKSLSVKTIKSLFYLTKIHLFYLCLYCLFNEKLYKPTVDKNENYAL